jgi:hypothetical protein
VPVALSHNSDEQLNIKFKFTENDRMMAEKVIQQYDEMVQLWEEHQVPDQHK